MLIAPIKDFTFEKNLKDELINLTKDILQEFLNITLSHPVLGCHELVYWFLHYPNNDIKEDKFSGKAKAYAKLDMETTVEKYSTENSEAKIEISNDMIAQVENIYDSSVIFKDLYEK